MKKIPLLTLVAVVNVCMAADTLQSSVFEIAASRVCKVTDRVAAAEKIVRLAEESGGWAVRQEPERVIVRVPSGSCDNLLRYIDSIGIIIDRSYTRNDCSSEYLSLYAQAKAKRALLEQYLGVLDSSKSEGVYPVARAVADLQKEIEDIAGKEKGMLERMEYARVTVQFEFHDRNAPLPTGDSDFHWLNTFDLPGLMGAFK